MEPRLLFSDEILVAAAWHNVVMLDLVGEMRLSHLTKLEPIYRRIIEANPRHGALILTRMPDALTRSTEDSAAVRAETPKMFKRLGGVRRVAIVSEADGLVASILSTFLRGMNMLSQNSTAMVLYRSVEDAAADIAPLVCERVTRHDVVSAMRSLRSVKGAA